MAMEFSNPNILLGAVYNALQFTIHKGKFSKLQPLNIEI